MENFKTLPHMESFLDVIREAPSDEGTVTMIVSRPETGHREILPSAELHLDHGLVGDNWHVRSDKHTADGKADHGRQLTIMNSRAISAITDSESRWPEAGDQLYVDFNLSDENIPPGTRLGIGDAEVEVTPLPHLGCAKFGARFGRDANMFVNSDTGKAMNLRGINARILKPGIVARGDRIRKL
jgi:MOSC domain-containing protein YiiM